MSGFGFTCEKQPATGARGMVVTNHPLASGAGAQILLAGGNAVDAAVGALFALTVVEPMMVGVLGGGLAHIRLADGTHTVLDGLSTAPAAARPGLYRTVADTLPDYQETEGRQNHRGVLAVAVPGALAGWCHALDRFGTMGLADALAPASVAEMVRLYGLRMWVEQSYKQVKHALGWSDYQVRSDTAIRRHWQLVFCAFPSFSSLLTLKARTWRVIKRSGPPISLQSPSILCNCANDWLLF